MSGRPLHRVLVSAVQTSPASRGTTRPSVQPGIVYCCSHRARPQPMPPPCALQPDSCELWGYAALPRAGVAGCCPRCIDCGRASSAKAVGPIRAHGGGQASRARLPVWSVVPRPQKNHHGVVCHKALRTSLALCQALIREVCRKRHPHGSSTGQDLSLDMSLATNDPNLDHNWRMPVLTCCGAATQTFWAGGLRPDGP